MSTTVIQAAAVAVEATPGSMVNGTPSTGGLTFYGLQFERGTFPEVGGAQEATPDNTARTGPFSGPDEASAPWTAGVQVHRQTGDWTVNMEVRGFGGGNGLLPDANSMPLSIMLSSVMHRVDTGGARLTPGGTLGNAYEVLFATGAGPALGEVVLADIDGCIVANRVTDVAVASPNDTVTFAQYWPRALTPADRVQRGLNFLIRTGANFGTVGPTFAMRVQSLDGQAIAYGCRLRSATFTSASGKVMVALVVKTGIVVPGTIDPGNVLPVRVPSLLSATCLLRRSALRISNDGDNVALLPAPVSVEAAEYAYQIDTFNLAVNWTLTDIGTGCGDLGFVDTEVSTAAVTFAFTTFRVLATHQLDLLQQHVRNVSVAAGPIENLVAGAPNFHNGWAAFFPAASLTASVNVQLGGEVTGQAYAWAARDYLGDDSGGTAVAANLFGLYLGGT